MRHPSSARSLHDNPALRDSHPRQAGAVGPRALVGAALCALLLAPAPAAPQAVTERSPNISGGWVGAPGTVHFNFLHRFRIAESTGDDKLVNAPTMLLAVPLPGRVLLGAQYSSNALVVPSRFNEWEFFGRWAPFPSDRTPVDIAFTGAYNSAAGSGDAEVSLAYAADPVPAIGPVRLLAAGRVFSDARGLGEPGWSAAAGLVVQPWDNLAIAGDVGRLRSDGAWEGRVWGAGLQLRIPTTPHTLSLQVTNTPTATLQGSSARRRTLWGFEFTVPIVLARYIPALRPDRPAAEGGAGRADEERTEPAEGDPVRVTMTDDLRFLPDTVRIQAGQTVVWENTTAVLHTVTADPERVRDPAQISLPEGADPFDSGNMFSGDVFRHTFTVPGEYVYVCVPHDMVGMYGTVIVEPE